MIKKLLIVLLAASVMLFSSCASEQEKMYDELVYGLKGLIDDAGLSAEDQAIVDEIIDEYKTGMKNAQTEEEIKDVGEEAAGSLTFTALFCVSGEELDAFFAEYESKYPGVL